MGESRGIAAGARLLQARFRQTEALVGGIGEAGREIAAGARLLRSEAPGRITSWLYLTLEKVPLLVLALAASAMTLYAQGQWGSVISMESLGAATRFANALTAYLGYLQNLLFPLDLTVIYPYPETFPPGRLAGAALVLGAVSVFAWWRAGRYPYVFTGWFWFVGGMVPMIGIVQVGYQAMADRYAYLPFIGLYILLVWAITELLGRYKKALLATALLATGVLMVLTFRQVQLWGDPVSVFEDAVKTTQRNYAAHQALAQMKVNSGELDQATGHIYRALEINSNDPKIYITLGILHARRDDLDMAIKSFDHAARLNPKISEAYYNLGLAHYRLGQLAASIRYYRKALELNPDYQPAARNLETALLEYQRVK